MSTLLVRTNGTTQFTLVYSPVNNDFVFTRTDVGTKTEVTVLEVCNSDEAMSYFHERIEFYCSVVGIHLEQLAKG